MKISKNISFTIFIAILTLIFFSCDDDPAPSDVINNTLTGAAGIGKTILIGETVTFQGTAEDTGGNSLTYQWTIDNVPTDSNITSASITNPTTLNASFTPDVPGDYTVKLTISNGTDTVSGTAIVNVVSYAVGLKPDASSNAGYIHNGELYQLTNPGLAVDPRSITIYKGTVYTTGSFNTAQETIQAVYWENTSPTPIDNPVLESNYYYAEKMVFDSNDKPEIIIVHFVDNLNDYYYWKNTSGYLFNSDAVSGGLLDYYYTVSNLFRDGNDVFQIGVAASLEEGPHHFFLAKNNIIIADEVTYSPDPQALEFYVEGECFNRGIADADSKVYIYGSWIDSDSFIHPGYTVNNGAWSDVDTAVYIEGGEKWVSFMASPDLYILIIDLWQEPLTYSVIIDGAAAVMDVPYADDPDVTVSELSYSYAEEIGGSVFVAGGYQYSDIDETNYNVAVIWRDGNIVAQVWDDNPSDNFNYEYASIVGADFE